MQSDLKAVAESLASSKTPNIALAKPYFDGSEVEPIARVLQSGWVTQGPVIQQFENALSKYVGSEFAVATSNCTTAMHLAWLALGFGPGHDVICPSYSFIASANAIRHAGAEPRFVDINAENLNIDLAATRSFIEKNYDANKKCKTSGRILKAILLVHQIGIPCNIAAFNELAKEHGLIVVEDAACAIGSENSSVKVGGSGNICAFSFHPRKVITTGEGGMLTLNDEALTQKSRVYRAHGMSVSDLERHKSASTTFEAYEVVGYNYRMTDIQASLGLSQMALLEQILQGRENIAQRYNAAFSQVEGLEIVKLPSYVTRWNYQSYPIRLAGKDSSKRKKMMSELQQKGIATRRGIPPIHQEPVYAQGLNLPVTEMVSDSSIFIPIYPQLEANEVSYIIEAVISSYKAVDKH